VLQHRRITHIMTNPIVNGLEMLQINVQQRNRIEQLANQSDICPYSQKAKSSLPCLRGSSELFSCLDIYVNGLLG